MSAECQEAESKERGPRAAARRPRFCTRATRGRRPPRNRPAPPVPRPGTFTRGENGELPRELSGPLETQIRLDPLRRRLPAV